eukprot:360365-Chlamydomonas_euryale.AAC.5
MGARAFLSSNPHHVPCLHGCMLYGQRCAYNIASKTLMPPNTMGFDVLSCQDSHNLLMCNQARTAPKRELGMHVARTIL